MKQKKFILILVLIMLTCASCSGGGSSADGGSEFGNPSRGVLGTVVDSSEAATSDCPADTVIATDSSGETTTAEVESDCSFDLELTSEKAYILSFIKDDEFIATLTLNNGADTLESIVMFVDEANSDIDLGEVSILGGEAFPEHEPSEQNDRDGDGEDDFEDEDDDNDGHHDDEEEDCDLDGFSDDDDGDSECEESEEED